MEFLIVVKLFIFIKLLTTFGEFALFLSDRFVKKLLFVDSLLKTELSLEKFEFANSGECNPFCKFLSNILLALES